MKYHFCFWFCATWANQQHYKTLPYDTGWWFCGSVCIEQCWWRILDKNNIHSFHLCMISESRDEAWPMYHMWPISERFMLQCLSGFLNHDYWSWLLLSLVMVAALVWDVVVRGLSCVSPLPWEVMGQICIRPKLMMITLNSAACCFQGRSSTSPSPANSASGYSSTVWSLVVLKCCTSSSHSISWWQQGTAEIPMLIHWGWVTHKCISNLTIIGSDNGLSPGQRQAIIWTNAGNLLIWNLGTNFSEILSEIHIFSFKKMHLKMLSAKFRPSCSGLNMLTLDNKSSGYPVVNGLMLTF